MFTTDVLLNSPQGSLARALPPAELVLGSGAAMREVRQKAEKVAATNVPVLIQGESGTGKEILAKFIHANCPWGDGPFVKVSCPAIPGTLVESELFGYERGAFTGAHATKPGRIEQAHLGTLFLDEIGELEPGLQAKLLHVLQDGQFSRIGAREDKRIEARVVCATNRDLESEIEASRFRRDLYYRINVVNLYVPPLRRRAEDIPALVLYFLHIYSREYACPERTLSTRTLELLKSFDWPGNIRQLENLIRRFVIMGSEETLTSDLVFSRPGTSPEDFTWEQGVSLKDVKRQATRDLERRIILRALREHQWNRRKAASALKISYRALLYKLREGVVPEEAPRVEDAPAAALSELSLGRTDS
jgi:two-component system response regulator AtoC